jgi:hypothetical protein
MYLVINQAGKKYVLLKKIGSRQTPNAKINPVLRLKLNFRILNN